MEEPGKLQSMASLRVGHNWATSLSLFSFMHWRRKWQPTLVFLPGESQGRGSLVGCRLWGRTESDTTEETAAAAAALNTEGNGNPPQYSCAGGQREEFHPWQRSWGRRLGIRKGVIKPQETWASNPQSRVCFMLSPTPLTLRAALPHNRFSRRRSKLAAPKQ